MIDASLTVRYEETYPHLAEMRLREQYPEEHVHMVLRSQRGWTIVNVVNDFFEHLHFFEPDVIVVQAGVVDVWPREEKDGAPLVDEQQFSYAIQKLMSELRSRPSAQLIFLGLCPTSKKMDDRYPGLNAAIERYNRMLMLATDYTQVFFVNLAAHITPTSPQEFLHHDDHHLNKSGHRLIAEHLVRLLSAFVEHRKAKHLSRATTNAPDVATHLQRAFDAYPFFLPNLEALIPRHAAASDYPGLVGALNARASVSVPLTEPFAS